MRVQHAPRGTFVLLLLAVAVIIGLRPAAAQSPSEILSDAFERHEDRLADVENLTIRQDVMGMPTTIYMIKESRDGHSFLRPVETEVAGGDFDMGDDLNDLWADPHQFYVELAERWELEGREAVEDREGWVLVLTDLEGIDWGQPPGQEGDFDPSRIEMKLDVDDLVPLEMTLDGDVDVDGRARPVSLRMHFSDYRETEGYLHPFVTAMETRMPEGQLSEEELEEARQALEEYRRQLEEAPEAQRQMMEQMMGDQVEMLENLVAGEAIRMEIQVTELLVNAGPPEG